MATVLVRRRKRGPKARVASGRPICLPGMGRCGTSLTTRLVGLLGVDLGPPSRMMPATEHDNARGYWEQTAIYEVNERLLALYGGSWAQPPELPVGWECSPAVRGMCAQAERTLAELFPNRAERRWGFKDPRAALTLPFWRSLVGEMDYVVCVRNPAEVAMSLGARHGPNRIGFEHALELWLRYTRAALANTQGGRRLILHYDDYFAHPRRQLGRLAAFVLGAEPSARDIELLTVVVEGRLRHHRGGAEELERVGEVCPQALELYLELAHEGMLAPSAAEAVRS